MHTHQMTKRKKENISVWSNVFLILMRNWVGLSKTEIDTRFLPVPNRCFPLPFAAMVRVAFVEGIKLRTPNKMDSQKLILKIVANCSELHKPCVVNDPMELLPLLSTLFF
jgi:hypothetical protein